jgi:hypothetical protein
MYTLYQENLSQYSLMLSYINEYKTGFDRFQSNLWKFDQWLFQNLSKYYEFQQILQDSNLIYGILFFFKILHYKLILIKFRWFRDN